MMEALYISISIVGLIVLITSVCLFKSKGKQTVLNTVIIIFSVIMLVLSVLAFLI